MNCNELQEGAKPQRYIIKRPKALQWFYNGRLYKESDEERQAGRFELFLDLLCTLKAPSSHHVNMLLLLFKSILLTPANSARRRHRCQF